MKFALEATLIIILVAFMYKSPSAYNWYYDIPEEPTIENLKIRIKKLEELVEEKIPKKLIKEN